jgi:uncharacterized protein YozE (UPF0346 family)
MSDLYDVEVFLALKDFIKTSCCILQECIRKGEQPKYAIKRKVVLSESGLSVPEEIVPSYDSLIFKIWDKLNNLEESNRVAQKRLKSKVFPRPVISRADGKQLADEDYIHSFKHSSVQFLFKYINQNMDVSFNEGLFDKLYKEYEYYEVTKKVKFSVICPLFNLEMDFDELKIEEDFIIRKITNEEFKICFENIVSSITTAGLFPIARYVLSTTYESDDYIEIKDRLIEKFYNIITALRLYGEGDLKYEKIHQIPISWVQMYSPYIGETKTITWHGQKYILNNENFDSFISLYNKYKESKNLKRLQIALSRFNFSYDRNRDEDKIIDLIVGFESLIVEEKERPWDRGAYVGTACSMLIGKTYEERKDIKKFLQDAFTIRNKIVHGSNYDKKKLRKIIPYLEKLLKKSLILLL